VRVYICAVILLMLGFLGVLIWSNMVFDAHRKEYCDTPLAGVLQALYIVVAIYIFREDIIRCVFCYNRERDGPLEPLYVWLFRRLSLTAVLVWPIIGGVMLLLTNECSESLKGAVLAIVVYYAVVAVVTVVIPGCFLSVMLILVRRGLVRMPRPATAAPEELADNLPKVTFDPNLFIKDSDVSPYPAECCICCEDFDQQQTISKTPCPSGNHVFHTDCLKNWLQLQHTCPLCRHDVTQPPPEDIVVQDIEAQVAGSC